QSGVYRSPGMTRLAKELDRRRPEAILDLGMSSTENVNYLSRFTTNLCIQDLFHGACDEPGRRSEAFRFDHPETLRLPDESERFDIVLMWDLIHYVEGADRRSFIARLASYCRPDAFVFLLGSSSAQIPLVPIQFKIDSDDALHYTLPEGGRMESAGLTTREVEGLMVDFAPIRCFQLRNGFQEFLFRYRGSAEKSESQAADPAAV
ncbi:MAG: class I SAM-dependent methyltransferase, partial [Acidobacteriota bacterium]